MKELLARLDKWLTAHRKRFAKNLQPGATKAQLDALAKAVGGKLPADLRALLAWHNGQGDDYVGYFENHWLLMSTDSIAAAKPELDATADDSGWKKTWIPFFDDDGGDYLCVDTAKDPAPVVAFYLDGKPKTAAASLEAWVKDVVEALEAGQYHEDKERGTFTRGKKS